MDNLSEIEKLKKYYEEKLESQRDMLNTAINSLVANKKDLEHALDRVERRNYELNQISYRTFHDMREPMVALIGLVDMLKSESESETVDDLLQMAEASINRLDNFSRSLSEYVRVIQKGVVLNTIDVDDVILDVFRSLRSWQGADQVLMEHANLGTHSSIIYDRDHLAAILKNLVTNAIRFRDEKKNTSTISLYYKIKEGRVIMIVHDNGIGISKTAYQKVTDMFYRASVSASGSGLGLYMTKTLVHESGGSLKILSREGVGTSVGLILKLTS